MIPKYYVRWGYTDELGNLTDGYHRIDWFNTLAQTEAFIKTKQKYNGSYFQYKQPKRADYDRYIRYKELLAQISELAKEFE